MTSLLTDKFDETLQRRVRFTTLSSKRTVFQLPVKQLYSGFSVSQCTAPGGFSKLIYFISVDFLALILEHYSAEITLRKRLVKGIHQNNSPRSPKFTNSKGFALTKIMHTHQEKTRSTLYSILLKNLICS